MTEELTNVNMEIHHFVSIGVDVVRLHFRVTLWQAKGKSPRGRTNLRQGYTFRGQRGSNKCDVSYCGGCSVRVVRVCDLEFILSLRYQNQCHEITGQRQTLWLWPKNCAAIVFLYR